METVKVESESVRFDRIWRILEETTKLTKENQKMIGELGNKFGSFAEGMALPSMEKILEEKFGLNNFFPRTKIKRNGQVIELDAFAYADSEINTAVVVEIKSHLKGKDVEQVLKIMERFSDFFPEHKDKKLYGIIAYIDASEEGKNLALKKGFYLANIHDEIFDLEISTKYTPKDFSKS
jgi:hypothetical protein